MPTAKPATRPVRIQAFVSQDCAAELDRLATLAGASRSEAVSAAILRGLRREIANPDDRLLALERRLSDHMRLTTRDLRIIEELVFAQTRILLNRFPESAEDRNPVRRAAIEVRLQRMLDDVASRIVAGPRRSASVAGQDDAPPPEAAVA